MKSVHASRRGFFQAVAIGGATAAAAVATTFTGKPELAVTASAGVDAEKKTGYQETEHIRQYYRTTQV